MFGSGEEKIKYSEWREGLESSVRQEDVEAGVRVEKVSNFKGGRIWGLWVEEGSDWLGRREGSREGIVSGGKDWKDWRERVRYRGRGTFGGGEQFGKMWDMEVVGRGGKWMGRKEERRESIVSGGVGRVGGVREKGRCGRTEEVGKVERVMRREKKGVK